MRCSPFTLAALLAATFVSPASAHSWYTGLRSPTGIPCCNDRDCRPVDYRLNAQTGHEEIAANGGWYPIEQDKVLAYSSPDGNAHACWATRSASPPSSASSCPAWPSSTSLAPNRGRRAATWRAPTGPGR